MNSFTYSCSFSVLSPSKKQNGCFSGSVQTPESVHVFVTMTSPSSSVICLKYIAFPLYSMTSAHFLQFCLSVSVQLQRAALSKNEIWLQPTVTAESVSTQQHELVWFLLIYSAKPESGGRAFLSFTTNGPPVSMSFPVQHTCTGFPTIMTISDLMMGPNQKRTNFLKKGRGGGHHNRWLYSLYIVRRLLLQARQGRCLFLFFLCAHQQTRVDIFKSREKHFRQNFSRF